jgi:hypothetical protein
VSKGRGPHEDHGLLLRLIAVVDFRTFLVWRICLSEGNVWGHDNEVAVFQQSGARAALRPAETIGNPSHAALNEVAVAAGHSMCHGQSGVPTRPVSLRAGGWWTKVGSDLLSFSAVPWLLSGIRSRSKHMSISLNTGDGLA